MGPPNIAGETIMATAIARDSTSESVEGANVSAPELLEVVFNHLARELLGAILDEFKIEGLESALKEFRRYSFKVALKDFGI